MREGTGATGLDGWPPALEEVEQTAISLCAQPGRWPCLVDDRHFELFLNNRMSHLLGSPQDSVP